MSGNITVYKDGSGGYTRADGTPCNITGSSIGSAPISRNSSVASVRRNESRTTRRGGRGNDRYISGGRGGRRESGRRDSGRRSRSRPRHDPDLGYIMDGDAIYIDDRDYDPDLDPAEFERNFDPEYDEPYEYESDRDGIYLVAGGSNNRRGSGRRDDRGRVSDYRRDDNDRHSRRNAGSGRRTRRPESQDSGSGRRGSRREESRRGSQRGTNDPDKKDIKLINEVIESLGYMGSITGPLNELVDLNNQLESDGISNKTLKEHIMGLYCLIANSKDVTYKMLSNIRECLSVINDESSDIEVIVEGYHQMAKWLKLPDPDNARGSVSISEVVDGDYTLEGPKVEDLTVSRVPELTITPTHLSEGLLSTYGKPDYTNGLIIANASTYVTSTTMTEEMYNTYIEDVEKSLAGPVGTVLGKGIVSTLLSTVNIDTDNTVVKLHMDKLNDLYTAVVNGYLKASSGNLGEIDSFKTDVTSAINALSGASNGFDYLDFGVTLSSCLSDIISYQDGKCNITLKSNSLYADAHNVAAYVKSATVIDKDFIKDLYGKDSKSVLVVSTITDPNKEYTFMSSNKLGMFKLV